jgi:hypothetical protein
MGQENGQLQNIIIFNVTQKHWSFMLKTGRKAEEEY